MVAVAVAAVAAKLRGKDGVAKSARSRETVGVARFRAQDPRAAASVRLGDTQQEKSKKRGWSLVIINTKTSLR